MLINYDLLWTLIAAGNAGSFAEAAARRKVTPSAISQQIKALEAALGVPLFERVGRKNRLTPAGAHLLSVARQSFATVEGALQAVIEDHRQVRGEIRLGGPGPFCRMWLRPRVIELLRRYPELLLDICFDIPSVLHRRLAEGELDVAILVRPTESLSLESAPLYVEEFQAVAAPAYLTARRAPACAEDFADHRFIVFDSDLAMHAGWWRAAFGRSEPMQGVIACRVASLDEMLALAEAGIGVAVLPDYFVAESVARGAVEVLALPARQGRRQAKNTLFLAWRRGALSAARLRVVREALLPE